MGTVIAAVGLAITIATILVIVGRSAQKLSEHEEEIKHLRQWRHEQANALQAMQMLAIYDKRLETFDKRCDKLEAKVFNGFLKRE